MVRALGLEPSLIRGKGPVPYQSGVTRIGGPGGNRTPGVGRRLVYRQLRPMARPTHGRGQMGAGPDDDAYAVVKVLIAGLDARHAHARKDSNPRPAVLETAAPPWLERKKEKDDAHDVVRDMAENVAAGEKAGATSARRACRYWHIPGVPANALDRAMSRVGTRRRRSSTGLGPGASFRR